MPNQIDANGLQVKGRQEIINEIQGGADGFAGLLSIYGPDVNLDPNSPDGNLINLLAQIAADYGELIVQVNAQFDPDQAIGRNLDLRCAINGVFRKAGTRTTQLVTVTVTQAVTLAGLDTAPNAPFTVSDSSGTRFNLLVAHAFGGAGSADLNFQAETIGAVVVLPSTLTSIVTVTLGVSGVTNGILAGVIGVNEESDFLLRIRRANSVELPSKGYLEGLYAALLSINGVTSALVLENNTGTTDVNGIPGHSIWCIVNGGTNAAVANAIFIKRNAGCGMKGAILVNVTQVDGGVFIIKFDRPVAENLYISFNLTAISGAIDATYVRTQLLARLLYPIGKSADASEITALVKVIEPNAYVSSCGVSADNVTYVEFLATATIDKQWALAAARVIINGAHP